METGERTGVRGYSGERQKGQMVAGSQATGVAVAPTEGLG